MATDEIQGYVQCEKLALLDLTVRGHKKISRLMLNDIINIADAVQGIFARYIKELKGDFYNVMGLPASRIYQELKQRGLLF